VFKSSKKETIKAEKSVFSNSKVNVRVSHILLHFSSLDIISKSDSCGLLQIIPQFRFFQNETDLNGNSAIMKLSNSDTKVRTTIKSLDGCVERAFICRQASESTSLLS
jgi:hypothetical protein